MKFRWFMVVTLLLALPAIGSARWIQDKVIMPSEGAGNIEFSHYNHLEAVGKNCPTCHNSVFDIVTSKNPVFTMADMEKGKSCGACHNGKRAFGVNEDCSICHPTKEIAFSFDAGKAIFSHEAHLAMDFSCSECHPDLFIPGTGNAKRTMGQMADGESCGACHDGDTAFSVKENCAACHPTKEITFSFDAGKAIFSHEAHLAMDFGCSECHPDLFIPDTGNAKRTMGQMADGESCGACHDGDTAFSVKENCAACHPTRDISFKTDAGNAVFSHEAHLGMDFGCSDCHPDIFTPEETSQTVSMDQMAEGESCGACHDGDTAFTVEDNCDTCHQM